MKVHFLYSAVFAVMMMGGAADARNIVITGDAKGDYGNLPDAEMFATFQDALDADAVTGGDTVYFAPGRHAGMTLRGLKFDKQVTLTSVPGSRAKIDFIVLANSRNVTISGFDMWPVDGKDGMGAVVRALENTQGIIAEDLDIRSTENVQDYPGWSQDEWMGRRHNGILLQGADSIARNNRVTAIFNGISIQGKDGLIEGNVVDGFSGDALRAIGENVTVRHNRVANCVEVSGVHNDGIQSWSADENKKLFRGVLRGVTLEGNRIEEWTNPQVSPLKCNLQGIFIGGYLEDLRIRNNVIMVTAWHGIGIYGASNVEIVHNTVVHPQGLTDRKPWIRIEPGRDGRVSENVVIANNIATAVKWGKAGISRLRTENNLTPKNMKGEFVSLEAGEMKLSDRSRAIDAGSAEFSTIETDIDGNPRVRGKAPDAGAYESP